MLKDEKTKLIKKVYIKAQKQKIKTKKRLKSCETCRNIQNNRKQVKHIVSNKYSRKRH